MTDDEVRAFIEDYRAAFDARDPHAIAALYDVPSSIVTENGTGVFTDRESIVDNMRHLLDHYTAEGFEGVRVRSTIIRHPSRTMAQADVGWGLQLADGELEFSTLYWLVKRSDGLLVGSVLSYSERRAFDERG